MIPVAMAYGSVYFCVKSCIVLTTILFQVVTTDTVINDTKSSTKIPKLAATSPSSSSSSTPSSSSPSPSSSSSSSLSSAIRNWNNLIFDPRISYRQRKEFGRKINITQNKDYNNNSVKNKPGLHSNETKQNEFKATEYEIQVPNAVDWNNSESGAFMNDLAIMFANSSNETDENSNTTTNFTDASATSVSKINIVSPASYLPIQINVVTIEDPIQRVTANILAKIQPVMEMAIDHVNDVYRGRINFTLIAEPGPCSKEVGAAAARVRCRHNISALIGTACSEAVEPLAYLVNSWNVPLITPIANTENIGDKDVFPRLTRINIYQQASIVNTIMYIMRLYEWKSIAMFSDALDHSSTLFTTSFQERMGPYFNMHQFMPNSKDGPYDGYTQSLRKAARQARVFLLVNLTPRTLIELLRVASSLGYTKNGDFVWLYALNEDHPRTNWRFHPSLYVKNGQSPETAQMAKEIDFPSHQRQALFFHIDISKYKLPKDFEDRLVKRSAYYSNPLNKRPSFAMAGYWDAVGIYATCINETLTEGGDPLDGLAVTRKMWNRTFEGLLQPITIDDRGDRDSEVTISGWNDDIGEYQTFALMTPKTGGGLRFQHGMTSFPWPLRDDGKSPRDVPICGYMGLDCTNDDSTTTQIITIVATLVIAVLVIGVIIVVVLYRRSKRHGEQDLLWWLIQGQELVRTSSRTTTGMPYVFSSKSSLKDLNHGPEITASSAAHSSTEQLALFKGQLVRVQRLDIKQVKLTNQLLREFKQVREISHTNLNRIHGATVDDSCVCLVMEHCPKGTLQDLLGSDHVTLDAQFKFSLTMDIIEGLYYIHDSPLKWHGRLTSEVCLVDNRFSVKIANYGLSSLHDQVQQDVTSQEYKNGCLWKSPEMLRSAQCPGSKESDVYSLGIILSEIVTREGPFGQEVVYMTLDEILHKISSPLVGAPVFRPKVDVPLTLSYMHDVMELCWKEEPKYRPSVSDVKGVMKKSGSQFCANGSLIDNLMNRMEHYANNLEILVEDKTEELREEKKRSEELLYQMLPRSVADRLKMGIQIQPENYECVTIYFSDIVGFTSISASSTPIEVVTLLNDLYSLFDGILGAYDVYKVETIGDAYMVVSGLPSLNGYMHASHIANMALDLLCGIKTFTIPHLPGEKVKLRIGMHSGPVCAGVVGLKMPRYCLFGDTVNTASRMESHGQELRIHVSNECKCIMDRCGTFDMEERGLIDVKGKGQMLTFWLTGVSSQHQQHDEEQKSLQ